uniref:CSON006808 protein n=1 Tax=Culicoides sonorensis TaxID=179676 RepID=A0A336LWM9_CULSO
MAFKFLIFAACVVACKAVAIGVAPGPLGYPAYAGYPYGGVAKVAAPALVKKVVATDDYDPNPQYSYSYDIHVFAKAILPAYPKLAGPYGYPALAPAYPYHG